MIDKKFADNNLSDNCISDNDLCDNVLADNYLSDGLMTVDGLTVGEFLPTLRKKLSQVLDDDFVALECDIILEHVLQVDRKLLYMDMSRTKINADDVARIEKILERRLRHEPLQYIIGKVYFYDREFFVDKNVLIPRPDSEILIETVLESESADKRYFADIGTGSGILCAVLVANREKWFCDAIDFSFDALTVAKKNICVDDEKLSHIKNNIRLINSDLLSAIKPNNQYDFIVSNPPYISKKDLLTLDKSVINYEPITALDGGGDGLDFYRMISRSAKNYLKNGGRIYLEIGYDQGESVPKIFVDDNWNHIKTKKDLSGHDRVVVCSVF